MVRDSQYYGYKKQIFDPNYGIASKYKSLYYTSDAHMKDKSKEGIAIWFDENEKIKIVKIIDWFNDDLVWYDDTKEILNRSLKFKIDNIIHKEMLEKTMNKELISVFKEHINKVVDSELRNLIMNILENPQGDYYLVHSMGNKIE